MATDKIKMPSDKEIWAEVDKQLALYPEVFKKLKRIPNRQDLFEQKKAWYKEEPKRLKARQEAEKAIQAAAKKRADDDKAYIATRKAEGKPVITIKKFKTEFPAVIEDKLKGLTAKELHERYELVGFIKEAKAIQSKVKRLQAATRELTYKYLTQTYGLFRRIIKSQAAALTFDDIKATLWNDYKIRTHYDSHRASIILKWVFDGLGDKTVHLYSRCFQLANGYDIDEADFTDFIKQLGGMEKIRKAYATVIAADAGTFRTSHDKDAEYSASLYELNKLDPLVVVQLASGEGSLFTNDLFGYYCLVLAHVDPLNQLEIFGQCPANNSIANDLIERISSKNRSSKNASWLTHKAKAITVSTERTAERLATKAKKQEAKKVKAVAAAKKADTVEKRFAKKRATQKTVTAVKSAVNQTKKSK